MSTVSIMMVSTLCYVFGFYAQDLYAGDQCNTHLNTIGECIDFEKCPSIFHGVTSRAIAFQKVHRCGFEGKIAIVCCPDIVPKVITTKNPNRFVFISDEDAKTKIFLSKDQNDLENPFQPSPSPLPIFPPVHTISTTGSPPRTRDPSENSFVIKNFTISQEAEYFDSTKLLRPSEEPPVMDQDLKTSRLVNEHGQLIDYPRRVSLTTQKTFLSTISDGLSLMFPLTGKTPHVSQENNSQTEIFGWNIGTSASVERTTKNPAASWNPLSWFSPTTSTTATCTTITQKTTQNPINFVDSPVSQRPDLLNGRSTQKPIPEPYQPTAFQMSTSHWMTPAPNQNYWNVREVDGISIWDSNQSVRPVGHDAGSIHGSKPIVPSTAIHPYTTEKTSSPWSDDSDLNWIFNSDTGSTITPYSYHKNGRPEKPWTFPDYNSPSENHKTPPINPLQNDSALDPWMVDALLVSYMSSSTTIRSFEPSSRKPIATSLMSTSTTSTISPDVSYHNVNGISSPGDIIEIMFTRPTTPTTTRTKPSRTVNQNQQILSSSGPGTAIRSSQSKKATAACFAYSTLVRPNLGFHILGGEATQPGEFPHMAALGYSDGTGSMLWNCGGSLITDRYVLTAAHCVHNPLVRPTIARLGVVDLFGGNSLSVGIEGISDVDEPQPYDVGIASVIAHPSYRGSRRYDDIALILLSASVPFSEFIHPACLYTESDEFPTNVQLYVTGWGVVDVGTGRKSETLLKANLTYVPLQSCNQSYQLLDSDRKLPDGLKLGQICAHDPQLLRDSCQGDSGGPLQILNTKTQMSTVIGVTSFGFQCGTATPGVYTMVSYYLDWIESIVWTY